MRGLWSQHFPPPAKSSPSPSSPPPLSHSPPVAKMRGLCSQPEDVPPQPPSSPPDGYERCLLCPTCYAPCRLLTSRTELNPNRPFYICNGHDRKFFTWADTLNPSDFIDLPYCGGCKAGVCRVRREKTGPNAGRILFLCTIKEGEGSCGYRAWQDEFELSVREATERIASPRTASSCESSSTHVDLVEESLENDKAAADNVSHVIDTAEHLQVIGAASQRIGEITRNDKAASGKMEQLKFQVGKAHESSKRPPKRSRHGDPKGFPKRNSVATPSSLISASSATPTLHLAKNSVSIRHCWMTAAINQNLSTELRGWWGRLAFRPMRNLIIRASCYISSAAIDSCSDEVFVNFDGSATITRNPLERQTLNAPQICDAGVTTTSPSQVALDVPSSSANFPKTKLNITMGDSISKAFVQVAMDLKNKFITLLETTDVQDHELMSREAEVTFAALDCLMFDHQELKEHTKEFIHQAMKLSEIKQSKLDIESHQRLLEWYSSEKMRLDEISRIHAETRQTLTSKQNHLKKIQERITSTKNWLVEIEKECSSCEAEIKNMEHVWKRISQDKEILEKKCHIAAKEFEESEKLHQHKKAQPDAVEASFDRARALLRGHIFTE